MENEQFEQRPNGMDSLLQNIDQKKREWDMVRSVGEQKVRESRMAVLQKFFQLMTDSGIDPSDQAQVSNFFEKLYTQNPDLYQLITPTIDQLLSEDEEGGEEEEGGDKEDDEEENQGELLG